ncbi:hypothetical protein C8J57DRAFT_725103 [Mycena rebaudengoi]|nr:hypothetical protein C8J57DRAFT_725103 [Mycena rebaudengoi]
MFPLALLPLPLFLHLVGALTNVTIDDTKTSMISYLGKWEASSTHVSEQDYGGSHTLSSDREASAIFKFTGVAVYYLAARWPYRISTQLRLDDGDPVLVDLTDHKVPSAPEGGPSSASVLCRVEG